MTEELRDRPGHVVAGTYFADIGGAPVVAEAVERLYRFIVGDADLAPYFEGMDLPRLKRHMVLLLTHVLGGPDAYDGRDLAVAHRGVGVTEAAYRKVVTYLTGVLWDLGAGEELVTDLGLTLAEAEDRIVERPGARTLS